MERFWKLGLDQYIFIIFGDGPLRELTPFLGIIFEEK